MISQWPVFDKDEIDAVADVLKSGNVNYWTGNQCRQFEDEFAKYIGTSFAIAMSNGTVALELTLKAAGVNPGDEVVVTPRTFVASASCIASCGARPVFADVDADSQNITADTVQAVLTENTRAIIAVHHAGWPCEMDELMRLANEKNLFVLEDCAQAHGALYRGRSVGGIGHAGAFSFCQDKIMTTGGEGGMLVTDDRELFERVWALKDHGKSFSAVHSQHHQPGFRWLHESFGTNARMTEMQAAIGRVQLRKLPAWKQKRTENARMIAAALSKYPLVRVPQVPSHIEHAFYRLYSFIVPERLADGWNRDRIASEMTRQGVPAFVGSCPEVYNEIAFEKDGFRPEGPLPVAQSLGPASLSFLVHPSLTDDDISVMCQVIGTTLAAASRVD